MKTTKTKASEREKTKEGSPIRGRPVTDPVAGAKVAWLQIRITEEEKDALKRAADDLGLSLSRWAMIELHHAIDNDSPGVRTLRAEQTSNWVKVCNQLTEYTIKLANLSISDNPDEAEQLQTEIDRLRNERSRLEAL